jgi:hypothetical protein
MRQEFDMITIFEKFSPGSQVNRIHSTKAVLKSKRSRLMQTRKR